MPQTKITKTVTERDDRDDIEQYRTTVPKQVVELLDLEGASLDWEAKSRNRIELTITRNDDEEQ